MARKATETADKKVNMETPEKENVKVVKHPDTDVVVNANGVIVFQAKHALTEDNYELLEKWVRKENEKSGLKIVLAPFSVDVKASDE